jgi:hypothetical protein
MSMIDEVAAKMKAQQAGANNQDWCTETQCRQAVDGIGSYRRPTLQEEAEKQAIHHSEMANKCAQAAAFLSANPAFDEFVRLVRAGVIQF